MLSALAASVCEVHLQLVQWFVHLFPMQKLALVAAVLNECALLDADAHVQTVQETDVVIRIDGQYTAYNKPATTQQTAIAQQIPDE